MRLKGFKAMRFMLILGTGVVLGYALNDKKDKTIGAMETDLIQFIKGKRSIFPSK